MPDWNAAQYLTFQTERTQPALDLAGRVRHYLPVKKALDVGCGPGNSTQVLFERFPAAKIIGIDNSPNMIESAKLAYPHLQFSLCDASRDLAAMGGGFDLVFSNACIQWVPNHHKLLREMLGLLNPGGMLAVQTPMNHEEPIHKIILEVAVRPEWAEKIAVQRIFYNLTPGEYYDLLAEISSEFSVWQTIYFHKMRSHEDIIAWYRSTGLRPYLNSLRDDEKPDFENDILKELRNAYPEQANGEIIFRFPRLFFTAVR
ncbi:MAG: methyltransferase domain-containing protein [Oscillospiraceae bacterium]|jgi:trans-aconitate 2-methyltransferase|nr:methyltransferase domain-containing protein [Oscillospiraceae bacterium]